MQVRYQLRYFVISLSHSSTAKASCGQTPAIFAYFFYAIVLWWSCILEPTSVLLQTRSFTDARMSCRYHGCFLLIKLIGLSAYAVTPSPIHDHLLRYNCSEIESCFLHLTVLLQEQDSSSSQLSYVTVSGRNWVTHPKQFCAAFEMVNK